MVSIPNISKAEKSSVTFLQTFFEKQQAYSLMNDHVTIDT